MPNLNFPNRCDIEDIDCDVQNAALVPDVWIIGFPKYLSMRFHRPCHRSHLRLLLYWARECRESYRSTGE